jgi:hypothetical protein
MPKRPVWSTGLPRPINIPQVMTLKTLADVPTRRPSPDAR